MEIFGAVLGLSIATWVMVALIGAVVLPALWLWMLIDAFVRDESAYPSRDIAEKIVWIVLMVVFQPVAALYFFMVWLPLRRRRGAEAPAVPSQPAAPSAA